MELAIFLLYIIFMQDLSVGSQPQKYVTQIDNLWDKINSWVALTYVCETDVVVENIIPKYTWETKLIIYGWNNVIYLFDPIGGIQQWFITWIKWTKFNMLMCMARGKLNLNLSDLKYPMAQPGHNKSTCLLRYLALSNYKNYQSSSLSTWYLLFQVGCSG